METRLTDLESLTYAEIRTVKMTQDFDRALSDKMFHRDGILLSVLFGIQAVQSIILLYFLLK